MTARLVKSFLADEDKARRLGWVLLAVSWAFLVPESAASLAGRQGLWLALFIAQLTAGAAGLAVLVAHLRLYRRVEERQ